MLCATLAQWMPHDVRRDLAELALVAGKVVLDDRLLWVLLARGLKETLAASIDSALRVVNAREIDP